MLNKEKLWGVRKIVPYIKLKLTYEED